MEELSLDVFRQQVVDAGFLTEEEGKKLFYADGVTSGTVRGIPFRAVHPDAMPDARPGSPSTPLAPRATVDWRNERRGTGRGTGGLRFWSGVDATQNLPAGKSVAQW